MEFQRGEMDFVLFFQGSINSFSQKNISSSSIPRPCMVKKWKSPIRACQKLTTYIINKEYIVSLLQTTLFKLCKVHHLCTDSSRILIIYLKVLLITQKNLQRSFMESTVVRNFTSPHHRRS